MYLFWKRLTGHRVGGRRQTLPLIFHGGDTHSILCAGLQACTNVYNTNIVIQK